MRRCAGHTVYEALVFVAILVALAGVLTPMAISKARKSEVTGVRADMEAITTAFIQYYLDTGLWPEAYTGSSSEHVNLVGFGCLYQDPGGVGGWDGPYLKTGASVGESPQAAVADGNRYAGLVDSWGTPYRVVYGKIGSPEGGADGAISLVSAGPDRIFSTDDGMALRGARKEDDIVRIVTRRIH